MAKKIQAAFKKLAHLKLGVFNFSWEIILATVQQIKQAQLLMAASSLAYTTILSLVPLLAVSFAVFHAFGGMERLYQLLAPLVLSNLTEGSGEEVIGALRQFIDNAHAEIFGIGGFVGLIITSMTMLWSAEKAINQVWQVAPRRRPFERIAAYWLFITLGPLALAIVVGFATSSDMALSHFFPSGTGMYLIGVALFFLIYKWIPNVKVKSQCAFLAAAITAALWNLARYSYFQYTRHVVSYHKIYGSLGAIPILLIWIYIVWVVVLGGAALTVALQNRATAVDDRPPHE